MNYDYIEHLLNRYFAAETSVAEENILKAFFAQHDVPKQFAAYASLFAYEAEESRSDAVLGDEFDKKIMARLHKEGKAPEIHVRALHMGLGERLRPLWRAAAVVAIVSTVAISAGESLRTDDNAPTVDMAHQVLPTNDSIRYSPYRQLQDGMKMAVTADSTQSEAQH